MLHLPPKCVNVSDDRARRELKGHSFDLIVIPRDSIVKRSKVFCERAKKDNSRWIFLAAFTSIFSSKNIKPREKR